MGKVVDSTVERDGGKTASQGKRERKLRKWKKIWWENQRKIWRENNCDAKSQNVKLPELQDAEIGGLRSYKMREEVSSVVTCKRRLNQMESNNGHVIRRICTRDWVVHFSIFREDNSFIY
jgi:hypothetical protein